MTFHFENVTACAFNELLRQIKLYGVELCSTTVKKQTTGTFRSVAGHGTFAYDGNRLTVTILQDEGHFSKLMTIGGLRQLMSEAMEATSADRATTQ